MGCFWTAWARFRTSAARRMAKLSEQALMMEMADKKIKVAINGACGDMRRERLVGDLHASWGMYLGWTGMKQRAERRACWNRTCGRTKAMGRPRLAAKPSPPRCVALPCCACCAAPRYAHIASTLMAANPVSRAASLSGMRSWSRSSLGMTSMKATYRNVPAAGHSGARRHVRRAGLVLAAAAQAARGGQRAWAWEAQRWRGVW